MSTTTVKIRVLRPFLVRQQRYEKDAVVALSPEDAALVLESGRGALAEAADGAVVRAAMEAATRRALKRSDGQPQFQGDPWRQLQ